MVARYGISTYGKRMLIDEGFDTAPPEKYIIALVNILLYVGPMAYVTYRYLSARTALTQGKRRQAQSSLGLLTAVFIAFAVNNTLRCSHMVDHGCRPVYYHEPDWAYEKVWLAEMEVPMYTNILTALVIFQGMGRLFNVIQGTGQGIFSTLVFMGLYLFSALFGIVHYTIEPPSNYGPFPNANIAGTALTTLPLILILIKICLSTSHEKSEKLISEPALDNSKSNTRGAPRRRTPVRN